MKEESLFNAGKIEYSQENYSECIRLLSELLSTNPKFKEKSLINDLITESYLNSNNYDKALSFIEKLPTPRSSRVNKVYQRVSNDQGIKLFNEKKYRKAINYFLKSSSFTYSTNIKIESNYWASECYSKLGMWDSAIISYKKVTSADAEKNTAYYYKSYYGMGYAYFNQQDYKNASYCFRVHSNNTSKSSQTYASSMARLGDCELVNHKFDNAREYYEKILKKKSNQIPYAHYAIGLTYYYQGKDNEALSSFDKVVNNYKKSIYYADALFQKSYILFISDSLSDAIDGFSKLIDEKPQSDAIAEAYLYRGKAYLKNNLSKKALSDFDYIINNYCRLSFDGNTALAKNVLKEIEILAQEELISSKDYDNRLDAVSDCLPSIDIEHKKFTLAQNKRYENHYEGAISGFEDFEKNYPNSKYLSDVKFLKGECYFLIDSLSEAKKSFEYVYESAPDNYYLSSVRYLAEIAFIENTNEETVLYNEIIIKNTTTQTELLKANLRSMFASFELGNYDQSLSYSKNVLQNELTLPYAANEALLIKGKSHYLTKDTTNSILTLQSLADSSSDQFGAEALWYLALIKHNAKDYSKSDELLFDLIDRFSAQTYWVNKAFLLMGDNLLEIGEEFQAKSQYELLASSSPYEDIRNEAQNRLNAINNKEAALDSLNNSPEQIEIGESE